MMGIWCDGKKWRARPSGYKGKDGEKIEPKAKQKRMDRDDVGALHQLDNVVRDALMAVLFDKRMYYRSQYDGDEQRQQAQYRVLERVGSKEELEGVLQQLDMTSKGAREELLKHQLLIRYVGFKSAPKKSWSCAKEGRKGTEEELRASLEVLLEIEKNAPLTGRLEVQFEASKQKVLGDEVAPQRARLDEELKLKAAANVESSAEAAYLPRAVRVSGGELVCAHGHVD